MKIVVFIFILIFAYDSELLNVYLGASNVFLVKIIIFLMLFLNVSTKKIKLNKQEVYVIYFLVIIHLYISGISVFYTGFEGLFWSFKFLIRFIIIIFFIMSLELYHLKSFIKWYRVIALILSVQSILLFVSIFKFFKFSCFMLTLNFSLKSFLRNNVGIKDIRFAFPHLSPSPFIVPCICLTPA